MLHFRMDITQIASMIISATHSVCRNLSLSVFFTLIIQISQILSNYSIYLDKYRRKIQSFDLAGATRYSGRRFFVLKCLLSKLEISPVVIARPQHVAVAISILRTVEIASLRSQ